MWQPLTSFNRMNRSPGAQAASLLVLRLSMAGLMFWWGLIKVLNTGVGQAVSNTFYWGLFTDDILLIGFGWFQIVIAALMAVGLLRGPVLWLQLIISVFVALTIWDSLIDPFWLWMPGEKPPRVNSLFYPSLIIAAASWVLIALREADTIALDRWMVNAGKKAGRRPATGRAAGAEASSPQAPRQTRPTQGSHWSGNHPMS